MLKNRIVIATAIATAALLPASTGAIATTGTAQVGSTISATAWERAVDGFAYNDGYYAPLPDGDFDEYVYRLFAGDTNVDVQSTDRYDGLTEAQQNQWYEDAGLAPYEFSWHGFFCLSDTVTDGTIGVQSDAGIELADMIYIAADEQFPNLNREYYEDYVVQMYNFWSDGSIFDVTDYNSDFRSTVGYDVRDWGTTVFSSSYADFSCPTGSTIVYGTVMDPNDSANPAIDRELTIPEVLTLELGNGDIVRVNSQGVFLGVTGITYYDEFNAALWGMTQVDGELAATGVGVNVGAIVAVATGAIAAGIGVLRRRRTN